MGVNDEPKKSLVPDLQEKPVLAYAIVLMFGGYAGIALWLMHKGEVTSAEAGLIGTIMGYLIAEVRQVYGFYFGDSSASQAKSGVISSIAQKNGKAEP